MSREPRAPDELLQRYASCTWTEVYRYEDRSVTYRLSETDAPARYLKLMFAGQYPSAAAEAERIGWAEAHLPVPSVVEHGVSELGGGSGETSDEADIVEWLVTTAVSGCDATNDRWSSDVPSLVRGLAEGLRLFHRAPVSACPFDFRLDAALEHARRRVEAGIVDPVRDFHEEFAHLSVDEALERLEANRPRTENLVVCHGDYCLPNVLLDAWRPVGFVDLGELGVADRWWDLAVGAWSVAWNVGPQYEGLFWEAYGIAPDWERIDFYRLLYDLVS